MKINKRALVVLVAVLAIASTPSLVLAGEWTDRSVHESGDMNTYKRPNQKG